MKLEPFAMERLQSTWENRVELNISESGVHPLRVEELVDDRDALAALLAQPLAYLQTNGTAALRAAIAAMYPGASIDNVLVTNGGSEANCVTLLHILQPGDDAVIMAPNYMQVRGLARGLGAAVAPWPLHEATGWRPDVGALRTLVTARTKMILVCNPNNPTGARMTGAELDAVCDAASAHGAWVLADEIYRGAELDGVDTPTIWGRYERALVTSGLSKAYGLPGLRIGWVVGPAATIEQLWGVHDYTTIAPGAVNDHLARVALEPARRHRLVERTRSILRGNYPVLRDWVQSRAPALSHVAPEAGAIAFVRYEHDINSTDLIDRLRTESGVLVVPGAHFEMDGYLRIGFGGDPTHLQRGLERVGAMLDRFPAHAR
ncbi:MAG TPA: aminotransferase class I/II-fold pyridoxal phosphate-dependent enzyme [Vicinamibacterales bacterium]|nr:aminotransferase class I/II-fold pyridoxal phosphate-dependent enzyme [Vicinamibacterales bacterium]